MALDNPQAILTSPTPVRVAFCHYTADVGGGSDKALLDLVAHLPRDRFIPSMILKPDDPMAPAYRSAGIEVVQVPLVHPRRALEWGRLVQYFLHFWPSTFKVAHAIRRLDADVVHVNTLFNIQGAVAARLARRPLVWHVREIVPGSRLVAVMLGLVRILANRAVAISSAVAETLQGCGNRLHIVFDGIDLDPYQDLDGGPVRDALRLGPEQPVVTTVGRIEPWKGQRTLVDAAPAILSAYPDAHILIVGGVAVNKPAYAQDLRQRCEDLGIAGNVHFTGIRDDVPAVLAASSVLVLPTATPEPFGLTVPEAMAAGCPVVATAAGGPLDTVVDGETGYLVAPNDPAALAEKVCAVLADPARARAMGESGRRRAARLFSIERVAREMGELFAETAAEMRLHR